MRTCKVTFLLLLVALLAAACCACAQPEAETPVPETPASETGEAENAAPSAAAPQPAQSLPESQPQVDDALSVAQQPASELSTQDAEQSPDASIEAYQLERPDQIILDYLYYDLDNDGREELIVSHYTAAGGEVESYNGLHIWNPEYPIRIDLAIEDGRLQYLRDSLCINDRGNIELLAYTTEDEWEIERLEISYSIVDGKQNVGLEGGVRYVLAPYAEAE